MGRTDLPGIPATRSPTRSHPTVHLLPPAGALVGVVVAFLVASVGTGFWNTLHAAYEGYLQNSGSIAGLAIPIGALVGFMASLALGEKRLHPRQEHGGWPRIVLAIWLSLAPALHWFAAVFLFLYASRYTPTGGKTVPVLGGLFHVLLILLTTLAAVCLVRRSRLVRPVLFVYLVLLTVSLVLPLESLGLVGRLHLMPIAFFLPQPAVVAGALALYLLLAVATVVWSRTRSSRDTPDPTLRPTAGPTSVQMIMAESTGFFLAALALLAYFLTSQFDARPTGPFTHALLLALAGSSMVAAMSFEQNRSLARRLFRVIAPALLVIELVVLIALHHGDEADPLLLMAVVMPLIVVVALVSAIVPFRGSGEEKRSLTA